MLKSSGIFECSQSREVLPRPSLMKHILGGPGTELWQRVVDGRPFSTLANPRVRARLLRKDAVQRAEANSQNIRKRGEVRIDRAAAR